MHVEWEAPVEGARRPTLVLVHGGGGQALDWRVTADGRPGWVDTLVRAGHAVYIVDRPGHGRSRGAATGKTREPAPASTASFIFATATPGHIQWPWASDPTADEVRQIAAGAAGLPEDLAAAQRLEADRLGALLRRIGPVVLVTHSLGACSGWIAAAENPIAVQAIVALEPAGPPFAQIPGVGDLTWGISAAELPFEPPAVADDVQTDTGRFCVSGLGGIPIGIISAPESPLRAAAEPVVRFLQDVGADAREISLADHGILGNGHGMMLEANSDQVAGFVSDWIAGSVSHDARTIDEE